MVNTRPKRLYSIKNIPSYRCFPFAMCMFPIIHLVCPLIILYNQYLYFFLEVTVIIIHEKKSKGLANFLGANKLFYGRCAKGEWVVWYNVTKVLSIEGSPGLRMLQRIKCLNKQYVKLVALLLLQNTVN